MSGAHARERAADEPEFCTATGKRKYASIGDVKRAMRGLRASLRFYRCTECRGFPRIGRRRSRVEGVLGHGREPSCDHQLRRVRRGDRRARGR